MFISILFFIAQACDELCESHCTRFNGKVACFKSCGCEARAEILFPNVLTEAYKDFIKASFECRTEDVLLCERGKDSEYYFCLLEKNCLMAANPIQLTEEVPAYLWPAVRPLKLLPQAQIPSKSSSPCHKCLHIYEEKAYFSCISRNCNQEIQRKISLFSDLIKDSELCISCNGLRHEEYTSCVFRSCRSLVSDKKLLFKSEVQLSLSDLEKVKNCGDCEALIYADDYFNCVSYFCQGPENKQNKLFLTEENTGKCGRCRSESGERYEMCCMLNCEDGVEGEVKRAVQAQGGAMAKRSRRCENCKLLLGVQYLACMKNSCEVSKLETSSFPIVLFLGFAVFCLVILLSLQKLLRSSLVSDETQASYKILVD